MSDEVCLHVGVPKSGTTSLQEVLWTNLDRLHELGATVAASAYVDHARAAADLTARRTGPAVTGAWEHQVERIRSTQDRVVLSHEHLVVAGSTQVERAVRSLAPRRLTVVITARDLARQIASSWQQQVKQRFTGSLAAFATGVVERSAVAPDFWPQQDVLAAVDTWREHVPVERIVLVTVPPAGSRPELLWERFASACGLDPTGFELDVDTPNESLGGAQTELLRRVNVALGDRVPLDAGYLGLVRRLFANDLLAGQVAYEHFGVDEVTHAWATATGRYWVTGLQERGVKILGAAADLVPAPFAPSLDPAAMDERAISAAATELLADLLARWQSLGRATPRRSSDRLRDAGARRRPPVGVPERPFGR